MRKIKIHATNGKLQYIETKGKWKYKLIKQFHMYVPLPFKRIKHEYMTVTPNGLIIQRGYAWDGASCVPDKGFIEASLIHDALLQLVEQDLLHTKHESFIHRLFRGVALHVGTNKYLAAVYYYGTKTFYPLYKWVKGKWRNLWKS